MSSDKYRRYKDGLLIASARTEVSVIRREMRVPAYDVHKVDPGIDRVRSQEAQTRAALLDILTRIHRATRQAKPLAKYFGLDGEFDRIDAIAADVASRVQQ